MFDFKLIWMKNLFCDILSSLQKRKADKLTYGNFAICDFGTFKPQKYERI